MAAVDFLIKRSDLHQVRFTDSEVPEPGEGEAVLAVERFGLTANNITYAVFGEAMNYWDFFPADEGWGRMPVWGFATVTSSEHPELDEGIRVYGYLPPSSHLRVVPDRVDERGFVDAAPHRAPLPSAYQGYRRVDADPAYAADREDEQILFWPLFYTSFLVDDFFAEEELFGASTVILSSASSKTALIAAFLLAQREGVELVGLTSAGNAEFVRGLGVYDEVLTYEQTDSLPAKAIYADFSGDAAVRAAVHEHCELAHSATIGMTHWEEMDAGSSELAAPKPRFFFAPDRIRKRGEDWGVAELEQRVAAAWHPFAEWTRGWLEVRRGEGREALERTYLEVLDGEIGPEIGPVLSLGADELAIMRAMFDAWNEGNVERMIEFWADDGEWEDAPGWPGRRSVRGRVEIEAHLREVIELLGEMRVEIDELVRVGDEVVAVARMTVQGARSGVAVDGPFCPAIRFEDGRMRRCRVFADREQAIRAAREGDRA